MPTNVTAEYAIAEKKYQEANTIEEKIAALREMYATAPKHKGTENLLRDIKARLAKLRKLQEKNKSKKKGKSGLNIKKHGAAQVIISGYVNTGKSLLFNQLTNTNKSKVAEFPFTTTQPIVGVMKYEDIDIQLIDLPPIFEGISMNPKGPMILSLLRQADLVIFLVSELTQINVINKELSNLGMTIYPKNKQLLNQLEPLNIFNANKSIKNNNLTKLTELNQLINKKQLTNDQPLNIKDIKEIKEINKEISREIEDLFFIKNIILINNFKEFNLDLIKELIWKNLDIIRIYTKEQGKKPDLTNPITAKKGSKLRDIIPKIHKTLLKRFKYAKIFGNSVKFDGAIVGLDHTLEDKDIIEIHAR